MREFASVCNCGARFAVILHMPGHWIAVGLSVSAGTTSCSATVFDSLNRWEDESSTFRSDYSRRAGQLRALFAQYRLERSLKESDEDTGAS